MVLEKSHDFEYGATVIFLAMLNLAEVIGNLNIRDRKHRR